MKAQQAADDMRRYWLLLLSFAEIHSEHGIYLYKDRHWLCELRIDPVRQKY